jgi:hypothetical protein
MFRLATAAFATAALLLAGCATTPKATIRSTADSATDFSQYRSFGFVEKLGTDTANYESLVSASLKNAARRQLELRGLTYSATAPDLLVNFNGKLDEKLRVTQTPSVTMGMGYYGYRGGIYSTWPMYPQETNVDQYTQGTLNVDVVDARRRQLVWEGVAVGRVTEKTRENIPAVIDAVIPEIFAKFPIAPKAATPPAQ